MLDELMRTRADMHEVAANREVIGLLRDGVEVQTTGPDGPRKADCARDRLA